MEFFKIQNCLTIYMVRQEHMNIFGKLVHSYFLTNFLFLITYIYTIYHIYIFLGLTSLIFHQHYIIIYGATWKLTFPLKLSTLEALSNVITREISDLLAIIEIFLDHISERLKQCLDKKGLHEIKFVYVFVTASQMA